MARWSPLFKQFHDQRRVGTRQITDKKETFEKDEIQNYKQNTNNNNDNNNNNKNNDKNNTSWIIININNK